MANQPREYGAGWNERAVILGEIKSIRCLRGDEEQRLAKQVQQGDDERAVGTLVHHNQRLVYWMVEKMCPSGCRNGDDPSLTFGDLFSAGCLGLVTAARRFEPGRGKFSTYATILVRREISLALGNRGLIRVPPCAGKAAQTAQAACAERGLEFNPENVALVFVGNRRPRKDDAARFQTIFDCATLRGAISLDEPRSVSDAPVRLLDIIADNAPPLADGVISKEMSARMKTYLERMPERDRRLITARMNRNTLTAIGARETPPLTRERVRQIIDARLKWMRVLLEEDL